MLDFVMLAALAACGGAIALLVHWCHKQVDTHE